MVRVSGIGETNKFPFLLAAAYSFLPEQMTQVLRLEWEAHNVGPLWVQYILKVKDELICIVFDRKCIEFQTKGEIKLIHSECLN